MVTFSYLFSIVIVLVFVIVVLYLTWIWRRKRDGFVKWNEGDDRKMREWIEKMNKKREQ